MLGIQKDSLMEISFHIPNSNTQFVGDENRPPAQVSLFSNNKNLMLMVLKINISLTVNFSIIFFFHWYKLKSGFP